MHAWRAHELGDPESVLTLDDVPAPEPGPGEVVVDVAAECGASGRWEGWADLFTEDARYY